MSRRVRTVIDVVDDLTNEVVDNAETISFGYRGIAYETDLIPDSARRMDEAFAPFLKNARKVGRMAGSKPRRGRSPESSEMRKWAEENGHHVPARGRVPEAVAAAYRARHTAPTSRYVPAESDLDQTME
ncbi:Lsr2 family protein [Nocardia sp. NEAU-G5]|uniref:Lsr2 family protein n=1 Tax=Nocardia albiluteola TaxID=2842303 RepID=A0ABS6AYS2_9NOCA|nr:Lsr2 family protein [Nocardia albiluteola]MBU3063198.1 Lsr2 family protein [Nocardia albiluteola]